MTSIGEKLRRQRLQNGISIEKVALDTKIGIRLLEAIEAEQFQKLPGGVFRRSFVLQYARALGLDPEEIAADLRLLTEFDEVQPIPTADMMKEQEHKSAPFLNLGGDMSRFSASTVGSLFAAVGVIMACALIYSWWQSPRQATAAKENTATAALPASPVPVAVVPAQQSSPPGVSAGTTPADPAALAPARADGAPVRVGLSAEEKTWVSISSDGKNVFANALEAHQTKVVEASAKVRLTIGNAGGVEISLNGKPIGPIGPKGQIRVVELTPAGFQIVPRKLPTVEPL